MSYCKFTGIGYVAFAQVSANNPDAFEVSVNIQTGERKGEEDQYYPSVLVKAVFWGKQAIALQGIIEARQKVLVEGDFKVPYLYIKDGEAKCSLQLNFPKIEILSSNSEGGTSKPPAAEAKNKKKAAAEKVVAEFGDTEEEEDDLFA
jgi:hypothetical protein